MGLLDTYYTPKYVGIKDRRLGLAYYVGMLATLLWLVVTLHHRQGYLEFEDDVTGVIRPRLKHWPSGAARSSEVLPYCGHAAAAVHASGASADTDSDSDAARGSTGCRSWDAHEVMQVLGDGTLFIATRVQDQVQTSGGAPGTGVPFVDAPGVARSSYYVADVESLELQVDGNVEATHFHHDDPSQPYQFAFLHSEMEGTLYGTTEEAGEGTAGTRDSSGSGGRSGGSKAAAGIAKGRRTRTMPVGVKDRLTVGEWLALAGVDLDDVSDAPSHRLKRSTRVGSAGDTDSAGSSAEEDDIDSSTTARPNTYRDEGLVLQVVIMYKNERFITPYRNWFLGERPKMEYTVHVERIVKSEYKLESVVEGSRVGFLATASHALSKWQGKVTRERTIRLRHGIYIKFFQRGKIGRFSWTALAMQFVLGLGSMAMITQLVDVYWIYLMPAAGHGDYNPVVFEEHDPMVHGEEGGGSGGSRGGGGGVGGTKGKAKSVKDLLNEVETLLTRVKDKRRKKDE